MKDKLKNNMLPIGPLMIEHRLIERMVALLKSRADLDFIAIAVDFFRFYADRCHHGKEEDILFRALAAKQLSAEHKKMMTDLLQEHVRARELIGKLKDSHTPGDIKECIDKIVELYTVHIQKEDKQFFIPSMGYFTKEEQDAMLCEFQEFDRKLIHEKYKKLVEQIEQG